jgi:hypothetical protein
MTTEDNINGMLQEIRRRRNDYASRDVILERLKLVDAWRAAHPEAAAEPASGQYRELEQFEAGEQPDNPNRPEIWNNDVYQVTVRRWTKDPAFGTRGGMVQIGISSLDGTARHDWRDFQHIKNQIAGAECEAFELYPAEQRLMDPSNYYTLWCFPGLKRIRVGVEDGRRVLDSDVALAPQRGFTK